TDDAMRELGSALGAVALAGMWECTGGKFFRWFRGKKKAPKISGPCFVAGTLVLTEDGEKPIEEIREGNRVWSYNHETGAWELRNVIDLLRHSYEGEIYSIEV